MDRWWRHCYGKCVKVPSSSNWNSILHTFISQSRTSNNSSVLNWFGWNPICALQLSLHIIDTSVTILKSKSFFTPPAVCYVPFSIPPVRLFGAKDMLFLHESSAIFTRWTFAFTRLCVVCCDNECLYFHCLLANWTARTMLCLFNAQCQHYSNTHPIEWISLLKQMQTHSMASAFCWQTLSM